MKYVSFTEKEKAILFDRISAYFYEANFGQASKSDIELMMFRFYIEKMIADNRAEDGTIDYTKCSDYKISKDLGITQQRVRNFKVKNQLICPIEYDWKTALAHLTENARYDKVTKKVTLNIPDPNLYLEIQNFIEENGAYVEKQLNSKVLQLRAEYYIDLILSLEDSMTRKEIIKEIKREFKESGKEDFLFDESAIGKTMLDAAVDVTTLATNLKTLISPENIIGTALMQLLTR